VWSENIGWVSFNNTSDGAAQAYGVKVDTTTQATGGNGAITGNAWSDNIGWVSFDRTRTGNPPAAPFNGGSGPLAQVDWSTGKVTGWMRALSACQNNLVDGSGNCTGSGAGDAAGGWDGWIKLSDEANATWANNGVKISANRFSGWAWGSNVAGWVDFAPTIGGVSVGPVIGVPPCVATDPGIVWGSCQALPSSTCVAPPATQTFVNGGVRVGACPAGGTTTESCDVTVACTPAASSCGDGVCSGTETPLSCSADCKLKYKQF
jgi:hypothetical protein